MKQTKQIIFVEPFPTVMVYKIAKIFRAKGYKTILIKLLECKGAEKSFHKKAFNQIISFNLKFYRINIKNFLPIASSLIKLSRGIFSSLVHVLKLKPYVVFTRAAPSWPCALFRVLFRRDPLIYFPYDIRAFYYKTEQQAKKYGHLPSFEIKSERFCFEHADGIIHKGDPNELEFLNGRMLGEDIKLPDLQLSFFPYCSREFTAPINRHKLSKKDKGVHIVHIDSMGSIGPSEAKYVYDTLSFFVNQKIHIHIYSRPNSVSKEEVAKFFEQDSQFTKDYESLLKSKYFHFHMPLEPDEITKEISKYDFGLSPKAPKGKPFDLEPNFSLGNKLSTYLESGIPLISHNTVKFLAEIRDYYKIGVSFDEKNPKSLKNKLKKLNYKELEKNIKKARKDFSMEKNFDLLESFVVEVAKKKRTHH